MLSPTVVGLGYHIEKNVDHGTGSSDTATVVHEKLRRFRERHGGMTMPAAAALFDTPVRTWEGWERPNGRTPPMCLWVLINLVDKVGLEKFKEMLNA